MALVPNENTDELLCIETDRIILIIKGAAVHPDLPGVTFDEKGSTFSAESVDAMGISLRGDPEEVMPIGERRSFRIRPLFFEQQRYEMVIRVKSDQGERIALWHENLNIRKSVTTVGRDPSMISGIINFGNEIGFSDFDILVDDEVVLRMTLEVYPSKIGYLDDYKEIMADITAEIYNLVFDFLKKTYQSFDIGPIRKSSPVEFITILRTIYDKFIKAADMVLRKPHHMLETERPVLPGYKAKRTDNRSIRWIEKHPEQARWDGDRLLVQKAQAVRKYVTYNTRENRMTKYMMESVIRRIEQFGKRYEALERETDAEAKKMLKKMASGIRNRVNSGFMPEVDASPAGAGMSLVFGMAPGYRELYRYYLMLLRGLNITGSVYDLSVKDLAMLYEYWCFIKLNGMMRDRYQLSSQNIVKSVGTGIYVSLVKGTESKVEYIDPDNGEKIVLAYNRKTGDLPTNEQKPDNILTLKKQGAEVAYEYVFDAKYRVNPENDPVTNAGPGPQEGDINTMHRYRDAIVSTKPDDLYRRTMFGAYVLFPRRDEESYKRHRFYKSIDSVNIGGLPFLPSATGLVRKMLDELIADSPKSAFERATLPAGTEEHLRKVDWSRRDVLIGLVTDEMHLDQCLKGKYYYTYYKSISDVNLPVSYVALYEPKKGIRYYGKILKTDILPRRELPGLGREPDEPCYKFVVGKWVTRDKMIQAKEFGYNPIGYTNSFLLKHAETVPELRLSNETEYRIYTELKRRIAGMVIDEKTTVDDKPGTGFELEGLKVLVDAEEIRIFTDGKLIGECKVDDFRKTPRTMFNVMMDAINVEIFYKRQSS